VADSVGMVTLQIQKMYGLSKRAIEGTILRATIHGSPSVDSNPSTATNPDQVESEPYTVDPVAFKLVKFLAAEGYAANRIAHAAEVSVEQVTQILNGHEKESCAHWHQNLHIFTKSVDASLDIDLIIADEGKKPVASLVEKVKLRELLDCEDLSTERTLMLSRRTRTETSESATSNSVSRMLGALRGISPLREPPSERSERNFEGGPGPFKLTVKLQLFGFVPAD